MARWLLADHGPSIRLTSSADGVLSATHDAGASEALVAALAAGDPVPAPFVVRTFSPVPSARGERAITVDQTNESVVVGERLVVKWLPRPERRAHPAPPVLAHLAAVGFTATARPFATVSVLLSDVEVLLALVVEYLPDAVDGWDWCVDAVLAGAGADFAADLGALTAELHTAFATPSEVFPAPRRSAGTTALIQWADRAEAAVEEAVALTARAQRASPPTGTGEAGAGGELPAGAPNDGEYADPAVGVAEDRAWLLANAHRLRSAVATLRTIAGPTPLLPIHGDLHVGQVLRWREGYAIVDFDGNPTVPPSPDGSVPPEPAARDVAQMLTSLDHVGRIADRRTSGTRTAEIDAWIHDARRRFLAAYRATAATAAGGGGLLDERLLAAFEVEQECRELVYAARLLPRWRYAPMGTLRRMFPAEDRTLPEGDS
ncbi:hypothetical protein [Cryptosporangium aurantiacum]|uniref:Glucosamine kinase n=1 Tax=Cryptosporangium aurantiacum TaxID=134849 RepID=A0A1M7H263_9ACTN|nr:hypothetical protein [Cryptosporangium aurantiacum]SHM22446.1 maltokinase [Cryptosporangium aurantiacum]